ncbi:hypothetical protein SS50377_25080 [Spironucleus salmonicida]|uniref:Uncharacterized protein n=1 Tax=Spironucleus salmonicida TaxID=348837 RepID=V6LEK8_9EUKA|nr:hypothetical protein SS50377_25080 [Spironucleus salmonicida]|eukprot:EST42950.1 Hypothetical protein SS50377_17397 [Spironucleus salmonicida]
MEHSALLAENERLKRQVQILSQKPSKQEIQILSRSNLLLQKSHFASTCELQNQEMQEIAEHQTMIIQRLQDQLRFCDQQNENQADLIELECENSVLKKQLQEMIQKDIFMERKIRNLNYQLLQYNNDNNTKKINIEIQCDVSEEVIQRECYVRILERKVQQMQQVIEGMQRNQIFGQIELAESRANE